MRRIALGLLCVASACGGGEVRQDARAEPRVDPRPGLYLPAGADAERGILLEGETAVWRWSGTELSGDGCPYGRFDDLPAGDAMVRFHVDFSSRHLYALYPCVGWTSIAYFDGERLWPDHHEAFEWTAPPDALPALARVLRSERSPYRAAGLPVPAAPSERFGPDCWLGVPEGPGRAGFYQSVEPRMFARYDGATITARWVPVGPRFERCTYGGLESIPGQRVHRFHAREVDGVVFHLSPCTGWTRFGHFDEEGRLVHAGVPMQRVTATEALAPGHEPHLRCAAPFELDQVPEL